MPETEETELVRTAVREALHRLALRFLTLPTHSLTAHPLYGSLCAALAGREARGWWLLVDAACEHMLRAADRAVSASALVWNILALQAGQLSAQELAPDRAASLVHLIHAHVTTMPPLAVLDGPANAGDAGLAVEEAEDEDDDMIVHGSIGNGVKGLELLVARELRQAAAGAGAGASAGAGAEAEAGADTSLQLASAPMIIQLFEAVLAPHPPPSGQPVANCEAPLLALCAIYGKLPSEKVLKELCSCDGCDRWIATGAPYIDVSVPMQFAVSGGSSSLALPAGSKDTLEGWFDPCPTFKAKKIYVAYLFKGMTHATVYDADADVHLPEAC